jgi:hypothetical protein
MHPLFISKISFSAFTTRLVVDADLAEFVFDHGDSFAVRLGENPVRERGFP